MLEPVAGVARTSVRWNYVSRHARPHFQVEGVGLYVPEARIVSSDWSMDPQNYARRLRSCGAAWSVAMSAEGPLAAPLRCDAGLCPRCMHAEGGHRVSDWLPLVIALRAAGAIVVHLTATRRWRLPDPSRRHAVVLRRSERKFYVPALAANGCTVASERGRAVPGESLATALGALRKAWQTITRKDRRSTAWWSATVAGVLQGHEWTGRVCQGPRCDRCDGQRGPDGQRPPHTGPYLPRWNAHMHALLILRPGESTAAIPWYQDAFGATIACTGRCAKGSGCPWCSKGQAPPSSWWATWLDEWCSRMSGAMPDGQRLRLVEQEDTALLEVLKYPFKPAELTAAQSAETIASSIGLHLHQPSGAWHGSSRIMKAAKSGDWSSLPTPEEEKLAEALAIGIAEREKEREARACTLLYRRVRRSEPARPRRQVAPPTEGDLEPPEVAPVTVRWLADRVDRDPDATEDLFAFIPANGEWKAEEKYALRPLLAVVTGFAKSDAA